MDYVEMQTIPSYEQAIWSSDGTLLNRDAAFKWSGETAPPAIGDKIFVDMNNLGPAIVTAYFAQDGWLGVKCRLLNPPAWHAKQNKADRTGHAFGSEIRKKG